MRKMLVLLLLSSLIIPNVAAQGLFGQWQVSKIGISNGNEMDMIKGLDYKYFADQVPASEDWALRDATFDSSEYFDSACENPEIALSITLRNPRFDKWEWRNDIRYKYDRIDNVSYWTQRGDFGSGRGDFVSFHGTHNELALETSLGRVMTIVNGLNITPSIGSNIGFTRNNTLCVREVLDINEHELGSRINGRTDFPDSYEPIDECFNTGSILNHRLFLEVKGSLVVKNRAELFMSVRKGIGYRAGNGHAVMTQGNMVNFGFNWILKRKPVESS